MQYLIVIYCLIILSGCETINNKKNEAVSMKIASECQASECDEIISESISAEMLELTHFMVKKCLVVLCQNI